MSPRLSVSVVVFALLLCPAAARAQWAGFTNQSDPLRTDRYNFGGTQAEAGDTNENYYDGDFADFDGDGRLDRGTISRYGLLWNSGGGVMVPVANTVAGATYKFGDKDAIGNDAVCWADVDNDGDPDSIMGGNGESFTLQTNAATRFSIKWQYSNSSAKRIVKIDLERDGDVDLIASGVFCLTRNCGQPDDFTVWLNDGTGLVSDVTDARGLSYQNGLVAGVVAGDINGDGDFDLVLASGTARKVLALDNNGSGTFTERTVFTIPDSLWSYNEGGSALTVGMSSSDNIAMGDFDNDGDLDFVLAMTGPAGGNANVFYPLFINDGNGNFAEQSSTRFNIGSFTGKLYATDIKTADLDADGDLDLAAYMQSAFSDAQGNNLQIFINDGAGNFAFTTGKFPTFTPPTGGINAFDVADYTGDGSTDLWVGNQGGRVVAMVNSYIDPMGVPADQPRDVQLVSATSAGVSLSWLPPPSASNVRFYRVYRSTTPGLPIGDRILAKTVALSAHADDSFVAPLTKFTTAAQLADASVTIDATTGRLTWVDAAAPPGVTYQYSIVHVGNETKASEPTPEIAAMIPAPSGADTTGPELTIVSPTMQHWAQYQRIVLQYADAQSAVDLTTLRVSFNVPLGGRAANADVSDLAVYKDGRLFVAALSQPYSFALNTLVTMTATVSDSVGNQTTRTVQFFVSRTAAQLPTAAFTATPQNGNAPVDVVFDATTSTDAGGKVVHYEWYFGDGAMATGISATHRYGFGGSYTATLVVRDTEGGAATTTKTITTTGAAPECTNGEVRSCYSGPAETQGVGMCVASLETCLTGAWQTECAGEVVPAAEVCGDDIDGDCDGVDDIADSDCMDPTDGDGSGCCETSTSPSGTAVPLFLILLALTRRRRRTRVVGKHHGG